MEISKENIMYDRITRKRFNVNVSGKESVSDGIKLLTVTARSYSGRCEVLSGEIIAEGYVVFTAVYVDSEGKICKKEHTERFTKSENCDGAEPNARIFTVCKANKVKAYSETGTIMFSSSVDISVLMFSEENRELIIADGEINKKEEKFIAEKCTFSQQMRFSVSEKRELSPRLPEAEEILTVNLCPKITEIRISAGQLIIGGEAQVQTVYLSNDEYEPIVQITDRFEFSRITDINAEKAEVYLVTESAVAEISNDENGEMRNINYIFDLCGYVYELKTAECTYLSDAYSVKNKTEVKRERFTVSSRENETPFNLTSALSVRLPEGKPPVSRISAVYFSPDLSESAVNGNKVTLSGTADVSVAYQSSGSGETEGFTLTLPIKIDTDICATGGFVQGGLTDMQAVLLSGGEMEIRYALTGNFYENKIFEGEAVTEITDRGEREPDEFGIIIYTVRENESMWDICKKFGTDEKDIRSVNENMKNEPEAGDKIYIFRPIAV